MINGAVTPRDRSGLGEAFPFSNIVRACVASLLFGTTTNACLMVWIALGRLPWLCNRLAIAKYSTIASLVRPRRSYTIARRVWASIFSGFKETTLDQYWMAFTISLFRA